MRPLSLSGLVLLLPTVVAPAPALSPKNITLSARSPTPDFSHLTLGVDRAPLCDSGASIAAPLHELRATLVRTHDASVLDWCVLFPSPTADTESASSYEWTQGDALFALLLNTSFEPYFRVGTSWSVPSPACIRPVPAVFARVAVRTLMHYNDGWAGGFTGRRIRRVEVWNEPDGERFWNLSSSTFYDLFDTTVRALKAYDSTLLVGGPGVSNTLAPSSAPYAFGLIDAIKTRKTPIDFYSWHRYGTNALHPQGYDTTLRAVRMYLDSHGLTSVRQHVTEWAPSILGDDAITDGALAASYTASALSYMAAAADVDAAIFYPACEGRGADGSWGLFEDVGDGKTAPLWRRQGRAYEAVGATLLDTPYPLQATFPPEADYTVLAGTAPVGDTLHINVVVSAQTANDTAGFCLTFTSNVGLLPGSSATVSAFMIDAMRPFNATLVNTSLPIAADGSFTLSVHDFVPPAVAWVSVVAATAH